MFLSVFSSTFIHALSLFRFTHAAHFLLRPCYGRNFSFGLLLYILAFGWLSVAFPSIPHIATEKRETLQDPHGGGPFLVRLEIFFTGGLEFVWGRFFSKTDEDYEWEKYGTESFLRSDVDDLWQWAINR